MAEIPLYESTICRLCAEDNASGEFLYHGRDDEPDLSTMVNRYLPIKISNDGKLPRTICPGCNIQLEATIQFFELLVDGQRKIREFHRLQMEAERRAQRERLLQSTEIPPDAPELCPTSPDAGGTEYVIKILPEGSLYPEDHSMTLQVAGLEKPKRKRGRPPKVHVEPDEKMIEEHLEPMSGEDEPQDQTSIEDPPEGPDSLDSRTRRRRKAPKRFSEAVQGQELERIFKEEGVIDEEDDGGEFDVLDPTQALPDSDEEVIGHLETQEGADLGQLVTMYRGRGRGRPRFRRRLTQLKYNCRICSRGFSTRSRFNVHKTRHKGVKFACGGCKKEFIKEENLKGHQKTSGHDGEEILDRNMEKAGGSTESTEELAPINEEEEMTKDDILEEMVVEKTEPEMKENGHEEEQLQKMSCNECGEEFMAKEDLEQHLQTHLEKFFQCGECQKTFANEAALKTHAATHETAAPDKGYPCDICGKVLNHPSSVIYHKEAEHNNGRRFVCNKCGKSFKHRQLLQRHQLVHSEDRPHVCKSCNSSFKTKANLINHYSTHTGEKKYTCEQCNQQFAHKTSLTLHYRWHSGHKPYTCTVCQKSFSQNGNLQEHMRIHTGEKPYSCEHCGRKFTTSSQFKLHVKRHTGERPWKCEFCAKSFLHKDTWKCHVRRHKGERPFQCADCNRGFTEQWALKKHMRLHTGEKPYSCDVCGKAFADCSNLTKHRKVHRGKVLDSLKGSELWQIVPDDEAGLGDGIAQVITEGGDDAVSQIIYVSYQDPDDPNQSKTLHFGVVDEEKEEAASLPMLEDAKVDLSEPNLQLQITDEEGNPIPLSIQDARQLLAGGQFVSQLGDGQVIKVQSEEGVIQGIVGDGGPEGGTVVKVVEGEGVAEGEQAIEFTTQDGQKVRLVAPYHVDPFQIASEYLTIG